MMESIPEIRKSKKEQGYCMPERKENQVTTKVSISTDSDYVEFLFANNVDAIRFVETALVANADAGGRIAVFTISADEEEQR